jgi:hypothetical protein
VNPEPDKRWSALYLSPRSAYFHRRNLPAALPGTSPPRSHRPGRPFLTDGGSGDEFVDHPLGDADRVGVRKPEDDVRESCLDGVADSSGRPPFDLGSARGV